jgi:amidase
MLLTHLCKALTDWQLHKNKCRKTFVRVLISYPKSISRIETAPAALARARALGRRDSGLLAGVPFVVKANIDTGPPMRTHAGSLALAQRVATDHAQLVAALEREGAILVGKSNLSEWANFRSFKSVSGWSSIGGQTKNPHVLDRNPCGSSSGSAVAVAAGLVPLAIGTETQGSIVCPAGANGIVGLKPTLGLVSRDGIIPIASSQDTAGPMARSVAEVAMALQVIAEPGVGDHYAQDHPGYKDYVSGLNNASLAGLRVACV